MVERIEEILSRGGDADDALREVVALLAERYGWAGILFVEEGHLVLGPHAGTPDEEARAQVPVAFNGDRIAALAGDGAPAADRPPLERVEGLVPPPCLAGWDIGGEVWEA